MTLRKCCFCYDLRKGVIILVYLQMLLYFLKLLFVLYLLTSFIANTNSEHPQNEEEEEAIEEVEIKNFDFEKFYFETFVMERKYTKYRKFELDTTNGEDFEAELLKHVIAISVCILVIKGVQKNQPLKIFPFMIFSAFDIAYNVVFLILSSSNRNSSTILDTVFLTYTIICVRSLYCRMLTETKLAAICVA
ncbi:unnamed protein product [Chironomus riparius]|uniref:Uncharacterized protein n=1 Tax=Chironomus riparius TaxID=315576 RepID=A0A9N9S492_9DIPT|nr:unnamed protein product [Chironomus riparius]